MEKFKTKNLILASFIALAMMFVAMFGFAACGTKDNGNGGEEQQLTNADFVGDWDTVSVEYTPTEGTSKTYTKARYDELKAGYLANEFDEESAEYEEYLELSYALYNCKITESEESNKIQAKRYGLDDYDDIGTWTIENNQLKTNINPTAFGATAVEAEYKDGNIIVTITDDDSVTVVTLAKVVVAAA